MNQSPHQSTSDINVNVVLNEVPILHASVLRGDFVLAELLLEQRADIETRDENGLTPLHVAAKVGNLEFCKFLVANGADIEARDENDLTPLQAAVIGADVNA